MKIAIIQTSLSKNSQTNITALETKKKFEEKLGKKNVFFIDLRKYNLDFCRGCEISKYGKDTQKIAKILDECDIFILAYPVYNYSFSGVCKNFIDIFSYNLEKKPCGLIHNSSSIRSFNCGIGEIMNILSMHNSIKIKLPVIHTHNSDFENKKITNKKVFEKIDGLIEEILS